MNSRHISVFMIVSYAYVAQAIAENLKYQYLLGFYPRNTKTGTDRSRIRVTVDRADLFVKSKKNLNLKD